MLLRGKKLWRQVRTLRGAQDNSSGFLVPLDSTLSFETAPLLEGSGTSLVFSGDTPTWRMSLHALTSLFLLHRRLWSKH